MLMVIHIQKPGQLRTMRTYQRNNIQILSINILTVIQHRINFSLTHKTELLYHLVIITSKIHQHWLLKWTNKFMIRDFQVQKLTMLTILTQHYLMITEGFLVLKWSPQTWISHKMLWAIGEHATLKLKVMSHLEPIQQQLDPPKAKSLYQKED